MKSLRFYALIFTLSVTLYGLSAVDTFAQVQTSTPQIAKNDGDPRTNTVKEASTSKSEENTPSFTDRIL